MIRQSLLRMSGLAAVLGCACASPTFAQLQVGGNADFVQRYVWRGITRVDEGVLLLGPYLSWPLGRVTASAGLWASLQPGRTESAELRDLGSGRRGWTEVDQWAEVSTASPGLDARLGVVRYRYQGSGAGAPRTGASNTTELYARAQLVRAPLRPALTVWDDIDRVKGTFVEATVVYPVGLLPMLANVDLMASAGVSLGQEVRAGELANSARRGVTYVDFAVAPNLSVGALALRAAAHYQLNRDALTRRASPDPLGPVRGHTFWLTLGAGGWLRFPLP